MIKRKYEQNYDEAVLLEGVVNGLLTLVEKAAHDLCSFMTKK